MHGSTMGAKPYLIKVEERALKDFLFNASDVGLGKTRGHAMMYAEKVAKEKGVLRKDHITAYCKTQNSGCTFLDENNFIVVIMHFTAHSDIDDRKIYEI